MGIDAMKQRVERALDHWNARELDDYLTLYEPDAGLPFLPPMVPQNLEGLRLYYQMFFGAFSDLHLSVDDILCEAQQVMVRFHVNGTHDGPFMELPPTGRTIEAGGMSLMTFSNRGLVNLRHNQFDLLGLMQQLGAIPAMG